MDVSGNEELPFVADDVIPAHYLHDALHVILKASDFAARKHVSQRRKNADKDPYINHPIGVAWILINEGHVTDPVTLQAALLHDTVEDTDTTIEEICSLFGEDVARVVAEVTDDKSLPKAERKKKQVDSVEGKSDRAKLVKLADKLYNLRDLSLRSPVGWSDERKTEYFHWAHAVVSQIKGVNAPLEKLLADLITQETQKRV